VQKEFRYWCRKDASDEILKETIYIVMPAEYLRKRRQVKEG
jgi:hypothetical protein